MPPLILCTSYAIIHFRLLAVPARLGTQRPPAPEGARAGAAVRGHHDRHDPRLLRGRARQPRLRLFQPGAAPEARPHRLLLDGIRGAGRLCIILACFSEVFLPPNAISSALLNTHFH